MAQSSSGSEPATTGPHVPSAPCPFFAAEQATHVPVHAESQHTPSTQKPDAHWAPAVQAIAPPELLELELLELAVLLVLLELEVLVWQVPWVHV